MSLYKIVSNSGAVWTVVPVNIHYAGSILKRLDEIFSKAAPMRFNFRLVQCCGGDL